MTHDQSEAPVTVTDRRHASGALLQVGTPQDLFEPPANSFVARSIGNSNVVAGTLEGPGRCGLGLIWCRASTGARRSRGGRLVLHQA